MKEEGELPSYRKEVEKVVGLLLPMFPLPDPT